MATFKLQVNSAKVSGTHSDFPAYVDLSEMPTAFWNTVSNGGGDIRCYSDEALTTQLPREVVSCDTSTDTGELWVKTGMSTTTEIYITVDGTSTEPSASSTYGSENVWNANYKAVYHLKDANDSTANANNGTVSGATSGATGQIGDAYDFDGVDDYIKCGDINELESISKLTVSCIIKIDSLPSSWSSFINKRYSSKNPFNVFQLGMYDNTSRIDFSISIGSTQYSAVADLADAISFSTWYYVVGVYNGSSLKLYINGSLVKENTNPSGNINSQSSQITIGAIDSNIDGTPNEGYVNGIIDEVKLITQENSSDYITTEYNNQSDISTFWTITEVASGTMIKRWNGTAWEEKPLKRYNGSEWENITIKRYNGSSWDEI